MNEAKGAARETRSANASVSGYWIRPAMKKRKAGTVAFWAPQFFAKRTQLSCKPKQTNALYSGFWCANGFVYHRIARQR
jgi:hypothetical protein